MVTWLSSNTPVVEGAEPGERIGVVASPFLYTLRILMVMRRYSQYLYLTSYLAANEN